MEYLCFQDRIWRLLQKPILHIMLISIVGILAYSNTFNVPFQLDDGDVIVRNPIIKDLHFFVEPSEAKAFKDYFGYKTFRLRYVGYLTFALNYYFHGLNVMGYHIFNLVVHVINALLVYWLVLLTLRMPLFRTICSRGGTQQVAPRGPSPNLIALFSALLFVSHPVQTQAVTYIWQRVTSLATLFYLLSLVMYIKGRLIAQNPERRRRLSFVLFYLLSFLSAAVAMKTKEIAFTLPVIITLYEFMFFEGRLKSRILYLLPVLSTMIIIPLTLLGTDKPIGELISDASEATRVETTMSRTDYLFTQFRVIVTYIRLLFLPINQSLFYDYPTYHSFFELQVFLSFLFLFVITCIGVFLFYRSQSKTNHLRLIAFGIFWFFVTLSVESGIIPIVDVIFEHRVYLPSVGVVVSFSSAIFYISKFFAPRPGALRTFLPLVCLLLTSIVIVFANVTYARNTIWQDDMSLWEDTVKKSPNAALPHNSLGMAYARQNLLNEAISEYQIALRLKPDLAWAHNNLGAAYSVKGLLDMAIIEYQIALRLKPDFAEAHYNLAFAFIDKGNMGLARRELELALDINPYYYEARQLLNYIISNSQHLNSF